MPTKLRILIADDHAIVRAGIVSILKSQRDLSVIGEARDGNEAVEMALRLKPDVILMDLMMPEMDGCEATAAIKKELPDVKILLLTTFGTSSALAKAFTCGVTGAVSKSLPTEELFASIRKVAAGQRVISDEIARTLECVSTTPVLSSRHKTILNALARGLTNEDIAKLLGISVAGAKFHLLTLFRTLNVASRAEAVGEAHRLHLLNTDSADPSYHSAE